jgi:hypothetical protein
LELCDLEGEVAGAIFGACPELSAIIKVARKNVEGSKWNMSFFAVEPDVQIIEKIVYDEEQYLVRQHF